MPSFSFSFPVASTDDAWEVAEETTNDERRVLDFQGAFPAFWELMSRYIWRSLSRMTGSPPRMNSAN